MPSSRKRTKNRTGKKSRAVHPRPSYQPGSLDIDHEAAVLLLQRMPVDALPTMGLALWYMLSTPERRGNQCLLASTAMMLALRSWGISAELVGLMIDIPWARSGRGARYGNKQVRFEGTKLVGHVGLIADGRLIDPTAAQFPEIRQHGGARPMIGRIGNEQAAEVLTHGSQIYLNVGSEHHLLYHVQPLGSVDEASMRFIAQDGNEIARLTHNLTIGYAAALAEMGAERINEIRRGPHPGLAAAVESAIGVEYAMRIGRFEPAADGTS